MKQGNHGCWGRQSKFDIEFGEYEHRSFYRSQCTINILRRNGARKASAPSAFDRAVHRLPPGDLLLTWMPTSVYRCSWVRSQCELLKGLRLAETLASHSSVICSA